MSKNTHLITRINEANDEWYTLYEDVLAEVIKYKEQFANKVVYCNCDDPFNSNFVYFFLKHFNIFRLKCLISSSFSNGNQCTNINPVQLKLFDVNELQNVKSNRGKVLVVDYISGKKGVEISDNKINKLLYQQGVVKELDGNGDFASQECIELLKQCDICCTNPPFSLFRKLFQLLTDNNKDCLLLSALTHLNYKCIMPGFLSGKLKLGYNYSKMKFRVPYKNDMKSLDMYEGKGFTKYRKCGHNVWITSLQVYDRGIYLNLTEQYNPEKHQRYDNYDIINVDKIKEIPADYYGVMGVPLTFLQYNNDKQFKVLNIKDDLLLNGVNKFTRVLIKRK